MAYRRYIVWTLSVYVLIAALVCEKSMEAAVVRKTASSADVKLLTDNFFDMKIRENPWFAMSLGLNLYQDKIEEWNYEAFNRRVEEARNLKFHADVFLANGEFESKQDEMGVKIMSESLGVYLKGAQYMNYTVTLNAELSYIADTMRLYPVTTLADLNNWYARVLLMHKLFDDQLPLMDQAIASKLTRAKYNVEELIEALRAAISNSTENFFAFQPWISLNVSQGSSVFYEEGKRACETLRQKMITYTDKLENEYLPVSRDYNHEGVCNLPGGSDFYINTLRYYTLQDITPEYVHQLGLNETTRITDEMEKIVKAQGFQGSVREYTNYLLAQTDKTFPTSEALLEGYKTLLNDKIRPAMNREFDPAETGVDVLIVDDPYGGGGFYFGPSSNETATSGFNPGRFMYDGSKPTKILKATMLPLVLHETVPGHHYQNAYNLKVYPLPDYRRHIDYSHYDQDGYKFDSFTPYVEGWGLYSEFLGGEDMLNVVLTEEERLGQLSYESLRSARLVVDTGIHFYNWTRQRAEDYLKDSTILSDEECVSEIRRYIRWPGQACAYKIGELKLKELRTQAQTQLGDKFDGRDFHNIILQLGPSPLSVVEDEIQSYISSRKLPVTSSATTLLLSYYITAAAAAAAVVTAVSTLL